MGLLEHDHATASDAFETALSLSPSSAFSYHLGSVIAGWAGNAERAVEWGERALQLSPFDPLSYLAYDSVSVGHFRRGRYEDDRPRCGMADAVLPACELRMPAPACASHISLEQTKHPFVNCSTKEACPLLDLGPGKGSIKSLVPTG